MYVTNQKKLIIFQISTIFYFTCDLVLVCSVVVLLLRRRYRRQMYYVSQTESNLKIRLRLFWGKQMNRSSSAAAAEAYVLQNELRIKGNEGVLTFSSSRSTRCLYHVDDDLAGFLVAHFQPSPCVLSKKII